MSLSSHPRQHAEPEFLRHKQARWSEPHVAPLNSFCDAITRTTRRDVPYVDPDSGGVHARVLLLLLEAPSRAAAHGSGMVSADNDDSTAANVWRAYAATGLRRDRSLIWNAVPWYLGGTDKISSARPSDIRAARGWLLAFLGLLPRLEVIIGLGRAAQRALAEQQHEPAVGLTVLSAPHPSQRVYNRPGAGARDLVHAAFATAAQVSSGRDPRRNR